MNTLMIYGATGYTGRMVADYAAAAGTLVMLAGRDEASLATLAATLGVPYRVFSLEDSRLVDEALSGVSVILNCAGPFARTAEILMKASIRQHVHYLDVAAELDSYRLAETLDASATDAGVMLLPGSGGSVAMLGCLAAHAIDRISNPTRVRLALHVTGPMSRGSAISAAENLSTECLVRRDGQLVRAEPTGLQSFDFGWGAVDCFPVTLPDVVTVWRATHVPDIETFVHVAGEGFPEGDLLALPDGPTAEERAANRYQAVVEVTGTHGILACAQLDTVNGYTFTAMAAAEAGRRVLAGQVRQGFQTPAGLFGHGFAETIADTTINDLKGDGE